MNHMICYVSKYRFITKIEHDFLVYLENNGVIYVSDYLIKSKLRTNIFMVVVNILKKIERKIQLFLRPSRYFQLFQMHHLRNCSPIENYNFNSIKFVFISMSGLKIAQNVEVDRFKKEVSGIIRPIGVRKYSDDQSKCKIDICDGNYLIHQLELNYERDTLPLNNNIIVLRNLFEHIKQLL